MARKMVEVEFNLYDYFGKYGFGDGDDGAAVDLGYRHRDGVVAKLNEEFAKAKLPLAAKQADFGSIHNNCVIDIKFEDDTLDPDNNYFGKLPKKQVLRLKRVFNNVDAWLDKEVK